MCEQQFLESTSSVLFPLHVSNTMAGYVCCRALRFVLLFLLSPAFGAEVQNLKKISDHLQKTYGFSGQYALGINVPDKYCAQGASLNNFLSQDPENEVKNNMKSSECIYIGNELVGATPKPFGNRGNNIHSEYLLLRNSDPSPMQNLLNKQKEGCTVFYTKNSPCVKTCSTPNGNHSIIPALEMFTRHNGPKAFVFSQIWKYDVGKKEWEENILEIDTRIPVYHCNNSGCVHCVTNNGVIARCKGN
ncbi:uncharacterized protein LOC131368058 [Hemibagrus wyckioides]|uniref:uncharacterized protein LOC131368058 n=1 Tax=Hemibagrus wyckioides TaxID=337641 RepID=UPI00266C4721|nr:uncharacterized protein LOC131368058 [Hemibagrus wyckioides]